MANEVIKPADVHVPTGYNHAFKAGNKVYTAGQVALDRDGNVVGKGDIEAQTDQVFKNLQAVLAAAGGSLQDVVKLTTYITQQVDPPKLREVRQRYLTGEPPANTLLYISALASPDFLIEVEAVAVVG